MTANTKIEWADHTFNPWVGCAKVSPGCDNCYAEAWATRFKRATWGAGKPRVLTSAATWGEPVKWNAEAAHTGKRPRVFCASLADVFDNEVPPQWRWDLFKLIAATPYLDWLVLTKRIGNARDMLNTAASFVADTLGNNAWDLRQWPNVWLGATVVNQEEADRDIPKLLATPAVKRFLSIEPMLGPVDITAIQRTGGTGFMRPLDGRFNRINWVIVGGESGPHARPMHPDWARSLRDQCTSAGVPFFMKQMTKKAPIPDDLLIREIPDA